MMIRDATEHEIDGIIAIDHIAATGENRRQQIREWVRRECAIIRACETTGGNLQYGKAIHFNKQIQCPMQAFMASMSYEPSGIVHNLDEGDPELFYFKRVKE